MINLGPDAGLVMLNQRGQAAFSSHLAQAIAHGFFDGRRVHTLGSLGGFHTALNGLNNNGVVVGESEDGTRPYGMLRAFSWTVQGGMRVLPQRQGWGASAYAINDRRQVAGVVYVPGVGSQASRWNTDGSVTRLAQPWQSLSQAYAINPSGVSTGFAETASGDIHAMVWDAAGHQRDLGTLGGATSFAVHINGRGQVAGVSNQGGRAEGFFWSPQGGMVAIGADGAGLHLVAALNERGEVAGNTVNHTLPYLWSAASGLRLLPLGGAAEGIVHGLNNASVIVGAVTRAPGDWRHLRAVRWNGVTPPVDLTSRLYRPPAGLELQVGAAINDSGVILAHSNAGLVLLRPGRQGTAAPVVGPITGVAPDGTIMLGETIDLGVGFVDTHPSERHVASAVIDDGCPGAAPSVREVRGTGEVNLRHRFCQPGFYTVKVTVKDSAGHVTAVQRDVWVTDPTGPTLMGQGTVDAPGTASTHAAGAAALARSGTRFRLWAPLPKQSASQGRADAARGSFSLIGPFHFRGDVSGSPQPAGAVVVVAGSGTLNGRGGYRFRIEASDSADQRDGGRLRIRISHTDSAGGGEVVDYDNGSEITAASARATPAVDRTRVTQGALRMR